MALSVSSRLGDRPHRLGRYRGCIAREVGRSPVTTKKKFLPRRTVLCGLGVTIASPVLGAAPRRLRSRTRRAARRCGATPSSSLIGSTSSLVDSRRTSGVYGSAACRAPVGAAWSLSAPGSRPRASSSRATSSSFSGHYRRGELLANAKTERGGGKLLEGDGGRDARARVFMTSMEME